MEQKNAARERAQLVQAIYNWATLYGNPPSRSRVRAGSNLSRQRADYHLNRLISEDILLVSLHLTPVGKLLVGYLTAVESAPTAFEQAVRARFSGVFCRSLIQAIDTAASLLDAGYDMNRAGLQRQSNGRLEFERKVSCQECLTALRSAPSVSRAAEALDINRKSLKERMDRIFDKAGKGFEGLCHG